MKKILVIILMCIHIQLKPIEKPYETECSVRFFVPTLQSPLAYPVTINVPVINKDRVIVLPPLYKNDALYLKDLFGNVLNPKTNISEGPSLFSSECRATPFDIISLKKLAAYFAHKQVISMIDIPEQNAEDKSILDQISAKFAKPHGPRMQFYGSDLDNKQKVIHFDVELPTRSRYFALAPVDYNQTEYLKARLVDLYNLGLENTPYPLNPEIFSRLNALQ